MHLIASVHKNTNITVILVSHYLQLVSQHSKLIGIIHNSTLAFGKTDTLLTPSTLSKMYHCEFTVTSVYGKTVVIPK